MHDPHLFLFQDSLLLQNLNGIKLLIAPVSSQQNFAEAAFTDDLKEVEV